MNKPTCKIPNCDRVLYARGLCCSHHRSLLASGDIVRSGDQGCSVDGCEGRHKGRGLCQSHINKSRYESFKSAVSVKDIPHAKQIFERTGWEVSESGCWLWAGVIDVAGYGRIAKTPIAQVAHRVSYAIHFGMIPKGIQIHHICTVRACVNPMHLQALTPQENAAEMFERREYKRQIASLKREVARLKRELKSAAP